MTPEVFKFRLYVAGEASNSLKAIANLRRLCETHLSGRHEIEIVDVCLDPGRALTEEIYMTPTLVAVSPCAGRRIVGTLSNVVPILQILGLPALQRRPYLPVRDRAARQARRPD